MNPVRTLTVVARNLLTVLLVSFLLLVPTNGAGADTKSEIERAKGELSSLESEIDAQRSRLEALQSQISTQEARLQTLQSQLNALASRIDRAQARYEQTQAEISDVRRRLQDAQARYGSLRDQLGDRARTLYELGPTGSLDMILGSSSLHDLSDRVQFADSLTQRDQELANSVQNRANELKVQQANLEALRERQQADLDDLQAAKKALDSKFAEQQAIYDRLTAQRDEVASIALDLESKEARVNSLISSLQKQLKAEELAAAREAARRAAQAAQSADPPPDHSHPGPPTSGGSGSVAGSPFSVCPVGQPRAYGDSFGAPRYAGGYHAHAGTDVMAPRGTPVYAPFSGRAESHPNGLGGLSVVVYGSEGYVYNAHLDSYGTLGSVSAGTVIGYVGDSGDARGGPTHDHFEWHPNVMPADPYRSVYGITVVGDAIDPYPYLNQVC